MIGKLAAAGGCRRLYEYHESGRKAFRKFLELRNEPSRRPVLLPAYVGWSPRERSGVHDPLLETQTPVVFYRVDSRLRVDLDDFRNALQRARPSGVVLIHYFGYVDPAYSQIVREARAEGAWVLEDEAHALLTDLVMGASGRLGDAAIFSLHKILPVQRGGALVWNDPSQAPATGEYQEVTPQQLWEFDLPTIARRRRENSMEWLNALRPLEDLLSPLWGPPAANEVPQSLPMIASGLFRDALYHELNSMGIGVVSLYHTMIAPITLEDFPVSHRLSRTIINFPVHQDVARSDIVESALLVERVVRRLQRQG